MRVLWFYSTMTIYDCVKRHRLSVAYHHVLNLLLPLMEMKWHCLKFGNNHRSCHCLQVWTFFRSHRSSGSTFLGPTSHPVVAWMDLGWRHGYSHSAASRRTCRNAASSCRAPCPYGHCMCNLRPRCARCRHSARAVGVCDLKTDMNHFREHPNSVG